MRADGTALRRLTRPDARTDTDPAWSPDGRLIAFARLEGKGWRLHVMDADGTGLRAITTATQPLAGAPSWSPDGRRIAFEQLPRTVPGRSSYAQQVYVIALPGNRLRRLTSFDAFPGGAGQPAWSPDGRLILFEGRTSPADGARTDVWAVLPGGSGLRRLLADATDPAWAPDGATIAFVRRGDVYTATANGTGVRRLRRSAQAESAPSWSADGSRIAFAATRRAKDPARDTQRIWVIGADGTGLRALTPADPAFWAESPAWRPAARR